MTDWPKQHAFTLELLQQRETAFMRRDAPDLVEVRADDGCRAIYRIVRRDPERHLVVGHLVYTEEASLV